MKRLTVLYSPEVLSQDLPKLASVDRVRIRRRIETACKSPDSYSSPLCGSPGKPWRLDAGKFSVIFDWNLKEGLFKVYGIIDRAKLYDTLGPRLSQIAEIPGFFS
jgi:mRNA-degrading endonuclease RelE of RelBE toxin-antitoxin system